MRGFLGNKYVSRLLGALGAGATTYLTTGNAKSAAVTAATFLIYGTAHQAAQDAKN